MRRIVFLRIGLVWLPFAIMVVTLIAGSGRDLLHAVPVQWNFETGEVTQTFPRWLIALAALLIVIGSSALGTFGVLEGSANQTWFALGVASVVAVAASGLLLGSESLTDQRWLILSPLAGLYGGLPVLLGRIGGAEGRES